MDTFRSSQCDLLFRSDFPRACPLSMRAFSEIVALAKEENPAIVPVSEKVIAKNMHLRKVIKEKEGEVLKMTDDSSINLDSLKFKLETNID